MSLTLSSSERSMLHRTLTLLASPLDHPSVAAWRSEVLHSLVPLFAADGAGFVLPFEGEAAATLVNRPMAYFDAYVQHQALDVTFDAWKAQGFAATSWTALFGDAPRRLHDSDIYQRVYRPHRIENALRAIVDIAPTAPEVGAGRRFAPRGVPLTGMLAVWSDRWEHERFGAWGVEVMRLLQPAVRAAGQVWRNLAAHRGTLVRLVDESSDGLAIFDAAGRQLHRNRKLAHLVAHEPNAPVLERAILRSARALSRLLDRNGRLRYADASFEREVDTGAHRYLLRATRAEAVLDRRGAILIMVHPLRSRELSPKQLQHRFALTPREAEVALLLAHGTSNKAIAATLGVTEFTARRHTERVFRKMQVDSRAKVAARLHQV